MPDFDPVRIVVGDGLTAREVGAIAVSTTPKSIEVSFEVDELSSEAIADFVDLVDDWMQNGRSVRLLNTPQMLAHTLYKVGRLLHSPLLTISVQGTEPYPD
jgi:hypothetical protein